MTPDDTTTAPPTENRTTHTTSSGTHNTLLSALLVLGTATLCLWNPLTTPTTRIAELPYARTLQQQCGGYALDPGDRTAPPEAGPQQPRGRTEADFRTARAAAQATTSGKERVTPPDTA